MEFDYFAAKIMLFFRFVVNFTTFFCNFVPNFQKNIDYYGKRTKRFDEKG